MAATESVTRQQDRSRFELTVDDELAGVLNYRLRDGVADMSHTEVFGRFGGRGLGATLVRAALDRARADGWSVTPSCWFVRDFIAEHREYQDLVA
jgi:predicted GNAT family acetyltransferase